MDSLGKGGRQRSRRTPCYVGLAIARRGILADQVASWECLCGPGVAPASQGSFDSIAASLREAATPLRMTELSMIQPDKPHAPKSMSFETLQTLP